MPTTVTKRDIEPGEGNPRIADAPTDGHGFQCEAPRCGFASTGWPSKAVRDARWREHKREHDELVPMSSLDAFRAEHGIEV